MAEKLSLWLSMFEEEIAEPDLGEMGLILIRCIYLFYCIEGFGLEVEPLPYFGKASSAKLFTT